MENGLFVTYSSLRSCVAARLLSLAVCCATLTLLWPVGSAHGNEPLNVLFLIADDLNCDLGCYGNREVKSPNIDRLAAGGVRFERAYCQVPLCSPSRTSMLTGRLPDETGVIYNPGGARFSHEYERRNDFRESVPDTVTLPQLFRNNGYFAARVGKLYHYGVPGQIGTSGQDDAASWDYVCNPAGRDKAEENQIFSLVPGSYGGTLSWLAMEGTDLEQTDGLGATAAISLLQRRAPGKGRGRQDQHRDKPVFLAVGFYRPHTPFVAPKGHFEHYPVDQISLPEHSTDDAARRPPAAYASGKKETWDMGDPLRREAIQAYHASVTFMDAQVGRVLDALEESGLADSTIVVFTSDHGYHLYDHNLWQKQSLFENSARVPLIIRVPDLPAAGESTRALAELIDLYPTLADLAGLKAPDYLDGDSLKPVLENPSASVQDAAFTQQQRPGSQSGYSVRTDRWRYAQWDNSEGEQIGQVLFDMEADPRERRNLADDTDHADVIANLKERIAEYQRRPKR